MATGFSESRRYRSAVAVLGTRGWAVERVAEVLGTKAPSSVLWVGEQAPQGFTTVAPRAIRECLGNECGALVFDAHHDFHPDVFAAALGTLRGGGVLYLLLPGWVNWPDSNDSAMVRLASWPLDGGSVGRRFFNRLRSYIESAGCWQLVDQGQAVGLPQPIVPGYSSWVLNSSQEKVVEAIERVALGHAYRPLVLTADRGRGKSTAVGAALARLLRWGRQVILCAPSAVAVQAVFEQLSRELPEGQCLEHVFTWGDGIVRFRPAHDQLQDPRSCDLLVVDEAAALGLDTLRALAQSHNRLVFSTTVHGYEGSGRGFLLRFMDHLRELMPQCRQMKLQEPVRWSLGDPLEGWLNDSLLLDAEPREARLPARPLYRWVEQEELAGDESLLHQAFGLLVAAHYQTRPSDLQQLLDAPGLRVLLAQDEDVVLGAALLMEEGGFPTDLAEQVCRGRRRPKGHLLLQSLAQHAGWCEAPGLRALRVMRIAVQESARRQGIGTGLLTACRRLAREQGFDLLGTAFGIDPGLLSFWYGAGYRLARIGYRVDPASGAHSAQLLQGLSDRGDRLAKAADVAFQRDLPWRLQRELADLSPPLVPKLLSGTACHDQVPDARDWTLVRLFAEGGGSYADAGPSLCRWLLAAISGGAGESDSMLVRQLLMHPPGTPPSRGQVRELRKRVAELLLRDGG